MKWVGSTLALSVLLVAVAAVPAQEEKAKGEKAKNEIVKGRIVEVKKDSNQFTLRAIDGRQMTFTLGDDVKIRVNGREGKLGDLKERWRVLVSYEPGDNNKHRAVEVMPSPASAQDVVKEFRQAFNAAKSYAFAEKEEFKRVVNGILAEADDLIEDLAREASQEGSEVKQEFAELKNDLSAKRDAIQKRLAQAAAAGAESWDDLKAELGESLEELEKAYEKARARYEKKE